VQDPYVRLAPPNAPATGAFMVIKNNGDKDVKVVKADNPVSKVTELHTHLNEGGVMKMRPVPAIDIKAKGEAVLKPGGLHVMLIDLKAPMKEGDVVPITLTFDDGSSKQVDAKVVRPMSAGMAPDDANTSTDRCLFFRADPAFWLNATVGPEKSWFSAPMGRHFKGPGQIRGPQRQLAWAGLVRRSASELIRAR
jgi:copper(I)-binding protein